MSTFTPLLPRKQAPEILEGGSATAASDVYSFGMVGEPPNLTGPPEL